MVRGCLLWILAFVLAAAAYATVLRPHLEAPGFLIAAAVGAFCLLMILGATYQRWRAGDDSKLLRAAEAHEPPVDGKTIAVVGAITPLGLPLSSPAGTRSCVLYEYDISEPGGKARQRRHRGSSRVEGGDASTAYDTLFTGIGMTPSVISTPRGGVRLLSFPLLDRVTMYRRVATPQQCEHVRRFLATATTERRDSFMAALKGFAGALTDDDGAVRVDYQHGKSRELPSTIYYAERVIPVGEQICAIGRYSADKRGLAAHGTSFIRIMFGEPAAVRKQLQASTRSQFYLSLVLFLISHAVIGGVTYMSATRYTREAPERQAAALIDFVNSREQADIAQAIRRGASPNAWDASGRAAVHVAEDADTVRTLVAGGADVDTANRDGRTPLMLAVQRELPEVVQAWITAGAKVNVARPDGATALTDAEEAGNQDIANRLRAAGGLCDHVNAERGRLIALSTADVARSAARVDANEGPEGAPEPLEQTEDARVVHAVQSYLNAVHRKDLPALRRLTVGRAPGFFEGVDYAVWQATRPPVAKGAQGYLNAGAATVTLAPFEYEGQSIVWAYQLKRAAGGPWQIAREWVLPFSPPDGPAEPEPEVPGEELERPRVPPHP